MNHMQCFISQRYLSERARLYRLPGPKGQSAAAGRGQSGPSACIAGVQAAS